MSDERIDIVLENESAYLEDLCGKNGQYRNQLINFLTCMCRIHVFNGQQQSFGSCREVDVCYDRFVSRRSSKTFYMFPRYVLYSGPDSMHAIVQTLIEAGTLRVVDQHPKPAGICAAGGEQASRLGRFKGTLDVALNQPAAAQAAVDQLARIGGAVVCLPPGFGKTVILLNIVSRLAVPTVILVHTTTLHDQWHERIREFLPDARVPDDIRVVMIQTACRENFAAMSGIGCVAVDEAHHICAQQMRKAMVKFNAPYTVGLTATPERRDQRTPLLFWALGPLAFRVHAMYALPVHVHTVMYDGSSAPKATVIDDSSRRQFAQIISNLALTPHRILGPIDQFLSILPNVRERIILVLCSRLSGVRLIAAYMKHRYADVFGGADRIAVIRRTMNNSDRDHNADCLANARVMICTDKLASEGFDQKRIDTLIRVLPNRETVQTPGRAMRRCDTKQLPVYFLEICDVDSAWLCNMYEARRRVLCNFTSAEVTCSVYHMTYDAGFQLPDAVDVMLSRATDAPVTAEEPSELELECARAEREMESRKRRRTATGANKKRKLA